VSSVNVDGVSYCLCFCSGLLAEKIIIRILSDFGYSFDIIYGEQKKEGESLSVILVLLRLEWLLR